MNISLFNYRVPLLTLFLIPIWIFFHVLISFLEKNALIYGITPTGLTIVALYFYDKHPWKLPIGKWLVSVPNLNGTYKGEIEHYYDGKKSQKNVTLTVEQTASTVRVTGDFLKEGESATFSESKEAFFATNNNKKLIVYYESEGSHADPSNLSKHEGLVALNIVEKKGETTLFGSYFTNRAPQQTKGKIKVTRTERN
jgi:hypothetical protein